MQVDDLKIAKLKNEEVQKMLKTDQQQKNQELASIQAVSNSIINILLDHL